MNLLRHDIEALLREEVASAVWWDENRDHGSAKALTFRGKVLERIADRLERLFNSPRPYTGEGLEALRATLADAEGYARSRSLSAASRADVRARCDKARAILHPR